MLGNRFVSLALQRVDVRQTTGRADTWSQVTTLLEDTDSTENGQVLKGTILPRRC